MKKSFLGIAALFMAVTLVFAFKPTAKKDVTTFYLEIGENKFVPSSYRTGGGNCEGSGTVCSVIVDNSEIYTSGPYTGKPKVDITSQVRTDVDQLTPGVVTQTNSFRFN